MQVPARFIPASRLPALGWRVLLLGVFLPNVSNPRRIVFFFLSGLPHGLERNRLLTLSMICFDGLDERGCLMANWKSLAQTEVDLG